MGVSATLLLMGGLLTRLLAWDGAPLVVAFPVKAYFAVFVTTRNGLFEGFFYIAVGALLGMRHTRLGELSVAGLAAGAVLGILGCMFIGNGAHLPFCACAGICVFLLSIRRCGAKLRPHVAARNASTVIYLVHMLFAVAFVYGVCAGTDPNLFANEVSRPLLFLFVLGGSVLTSTVVIQLAKRWPVVKRVFGI